MVRKWKWSLLAYIRVHIKNPNKGPGFLVRFLYQGFRSG